MILHGNARGGCRDLAAHLMKPENERIETVEIRGFVSDSLKDALVESYAISKGTRCKQHLFSLSINPPTNKEITDDDYKNAADRVAKELGLSGQPRVIVRHWKRGDDGILRQHAHAVWCRIDVEKMKAIPLPFSKLRLREVSRELHIQHNIKLPVGLINSKHRNPRNFTLAQWQQCKRSKKIFAKFKAIFVMRGRFRIHRIPSRMLCARAATFSPKEIAATSLSTIKAKFLPSVHILAKNRRKFLPSSVNLKICQTL